jgi:hypothetical protein
MLYGSLDHYCIDFVSKSEHQCRIHPHPLHLHRQSRYDTPSYMLGCKSNERHGTRVVLKDPSHLHHHFLYKFDDGNVNAAHILEYI